MLPIFKWKIHTVIIIAEINNKYQTHLKIWYECVVIYLLKMKKDSDKHLGINITKNRKDNRVLRKYLLKKTKI